jgi:hypothetical protein
MNKVMLFLGVAVLALLATNAIAEVPQKINYQGRLTDGDSNPVPDSTYRIVFTIYESEDTESGMWYSGIQDILVVNGLFNYQLGSTNPFPDTIFTDSSRWLGIRVIDDPEITPRTQLITVPYAFRVGSIDGVAGGIIEGDVYIESDDRAPGDLFVAGKATIGPGNSNFGVYSFVAGQNNTATGPNTTISGGDQNMVGDWWSTVSGGYQNVASSAGSTVGGGYQDTASGPFSVVSGGVLNSAGERSTVSGGSQNKASGPYSTIGGGKDNKASGLNSTIGGGQYCVVEAGFSAIPAGYADTITAAAEYSYLFGIGSKLTQDSTFMIDMPHIRFGGETTGYEIPSGDGTTGQVLTTDGNGQVSWNNPTGGTGVVPVGAVVAWMKSFPNTPALPLDFVECNGQTVNDAMSPYNGQAIPDLNGQQRFLRGAASSGATGGSDTHTHTLQYLTPNQIPKQSGGTYNHITDPASSLPRYYEVVWIMRIK